MQTWMKRSLGVAAGVVVLLVGLVSALWLVDRDPVAGLVVYCALAALVCGLAALSERRHV